MKKMLIENKYFSEERALYGLKDAVVNNCFFEGEEDGESALKETGDISVSGCLFKLRYPLWHSRNCTVKDSVMTDTCRAALWYDDNLTIEKSKLGGIKAVRECQNVSISDSTVDSEEFGWKCNNINISDSKIKSVYPFFGTNNMNLNNVVLAGKYSFQYTKNVTIENSNLDTKDAFWHSENVVVKNSTIKGEYLGWYSKGLTLIDCVLEGTQPLCYAENLKLVNCTMKNCDLSFEYSDIDADVCSEIVSVKNPRHGKIVAPKIGEIIKDNPMYECDCEIIIK